MAGNDHPAFAPEKLKARLKQAKTEPVSFAFAVDKSGKEPFLVLHNKLAPKALFQLVKSKKDNITLGTWGTAELHGQKLHLNAHKKLKSFVKLGKVWVKENKLAAVKKIVPVFGGKILGEEDDQYDNDRGQRQVEKQETSNAPTEAQKKMLAALKQAVECARGVLDRENLKAAVKAAQQSIASNDLNAAAKVIRALAKAGKVPGNAAEKVAHQQGAETNFPFADLARKWIAARKSAEAAVNKLRAKAEKDYPHLKSELSTLGKTLAAAHAAKDPKVKTDLGRRSLLIADTYETVLMTDPLVDHLAKTPFGDVDLRRMLSGPLGEVRKSLAAVR